MGTDFNRAGLDVNAFLLTTRAGDVVVNLQTADTAIVFDSEWNPSMDAQAQDRAHRIGQQKEVLVLRMITAKSIEENVMERASFKRGLKKKVIRAGMFDEQSKDCERQAMLRELFGEDKYHIFMETDEERRQKIAPRARLLVDKEISEWSTTVLKALLKKATVSGAGSWGSCRVIDISLINGAKKRRAATENVGEEQSLQDDIRKETTRRKRQASHAVSGDEGGTDTVAAAENHKESPASVFLMATRLASAGVAATAQANDVEDGNGTGGENSFVPSLQMTW
ncbi:Helicase [Gracilaria domingensis]|nr:Helicase [Gracilaria domingensis]